MSLLLAMVAAAAAVFLLVWVVLDAAFGKTPLKRRLDSLGRFRVQRTVRRGRVVAALRARAFRVGRLFSRQDSHALLDAAAVPVRPAEWVVVQMGAALLGAVFLLLILPWWVALPLGGWL